MLSKFLRFFDKAHKIIVVYNEIHKHA